MTFCSNPNQLMIVFHNIFNEDFINGGKNRKAYTTVNSVILMLDSNSLMNYISSTLFIVKSYTIKLLTFKKVKDLFDNNYLVLNNDANDKCRCRSGFVKLRVGVINIPKARYTFSTDSANKYNTIYEELAQLVFTDIANSLNFKYDLFESVDNVIGTKDSNGKWNGLIEMLFKNVNI
jgi:hypothetical protein